jgi:hypothetical protein
MKMTGCDVPFMAQVSPPYLLSVYMETKRPFAVVVRPLYVFDIVLLYNGVSSYAVVYRP